MQSGRVGPESPPRQNRRQPIQNHALCERSPETRKTRDQGSSGLLQNLAARPGRTGTALPGNRPGCRQGAVENGARRQAKGAGANPGPPVACPGQEAR